MRNVVFRGKPIEGRRWVIGNLIYKSDKEMYIASYDDFFKEWTVTKVMPKTIGELVCENRENIYEGDIIRDNDEYTKYIVCWDESDSMFTLDEIKNGGLRACLDFSELTFDWSVIGNIHDNPELLEEE